MNMQPAPFNPASSATSARPNVVFYNLTCAGSSAIVPILEEILSEDYGYTIWGNPENTDQFIEHFDSAKPHLHWTHSPALRFESFLKRDDFRFICLYRDPRDAFVSHIKDLIHRGLHQDLPEHQLYHENIGSNFMGLFDYADEWVQLNQENIFKLRFEDLKADTPKQARKIFEFLGLSVGDQRLRESCNRYSFESMAKRQRGAEGEMIRSNLMFRKGISGDWKNEFDPSVTQEFEQQFGHIINRWDYGTKPQRREVQLVSAPMPCGVGWLVNVLLELDIQATNASPNYKDHHWQTDEQGRTRFHPKAAAHLKWHLPVLRTDRHFMFERDVHVRWEHRLDMAREPRPTILFTRDGRDAVYSHYRRHHSDSSSFEDFLKEPCTWPDHFPDLFDLPPAESWALFNYIWLEMASVMPVQVVRFEDAKENPQQVVQQVLQFLGVHRSSGEITLALENSSYEKAMAQEQSTSTELNQSIRGNHRRGKAYEWKGHYTPAQLNAFSGLADEVLDRMGYESNAPRPKSAATDPPLGSEKYPEISKQVIAGNFGPARRLIRKELANPTTKSNLSGLLAEFISLKWTGLIYKVDFAQSIAANQFRKSVGKMLMRHEKSKAILDMHTRNLGEDLALTYLGKHRGYLLVQSDNSFLALSPDLGDDFHLGRQTRESILQLAGQGLCIVTSSENRLAPAIDTLLDSVLENARTYLNSGDAAAALEIANRCLELSGGEDSKSRQFSEHVTRILAKRENAKSPAFSGVF